MYRKKLNNILSFILACVLILVSCVNVVAWNSEDIIEHSWSGNIVANSDFSNNTDGNSDFKYKDFPNITVGTIPTGYTDAEYGDSLLCNGATSVSPYFYLNYFNTPEGTHKKLGYLQKKQAKLLVKFNIKVPKGNLASSPTISIRTNQIIPKSTTSGVTETFNDDGNKISLGTLNSGQWYSFEREFDFSKLPYDSLIRAYDSYTQSLTLDTEWWLYFEFKFKSDAVQVDRVFYVDNISIQYKYADVTPSLNLLSLPGAVTPPSSVSFVTNDALDLDGDGKSLKFANNDSSSGGRWRNVLEFTPSQPLIADKIYNLSFYYKQDSSTAFNPTVYLRYAQMSASYYDFVSDSAGSVYCWVPKLATPPYADGMTKQQLADTLGIDVSAVSSSYYRYSHSLNQSGQWIRADYTFRATSDMAQNMKNFYIVAPPAVDANADGNHNFWIDCISLRTVPANTLMLSLDKTEYLALENSEGLTVKLPLYIDIYSPVDVKIEGYTGDLLVTPNKDIHGVDVDISPITSQSGLWNFSLTAFDLWGSEYERSGEYTFNGLNLEITKNIDYQIKLNKIDWSGNIINNFDFEASGEGLNAIKNDYGSYNTDFDSNALDLGVVVDVDEEHGKAVLISPNDVTKSQSVFYFLGVNYGGNSHADVTNVLNDRRMIKVEFDYKARSTVGISRFLVENRGSKFIVPSIRSEIPVSNISATEWQRFEGVFDLGSVDVNRLSDESLSGPFWLSAFDVQWNLSDITAESGIYIDNVSVKAAVETPAESSVSGEYIVRAQLTNNGTEAAEYKATVIANGYKYNKMTQIKLEEFDTSGTGGRGFTDGKLPVGASVSFGSIITLSENEELGGFIWDSLDSMIPLARKKVL